MPIRTYLPVQTCEVSETSQVLAEFMLGQRFITKVCLLHIYKIRIYKISTKRRLHWHIKVNLLVFELYQNLIDLLITFCLQII